VLKQRERQRQRQYFFIADNYLYGGCITFTAHLMHLLGRKCFRRITNRFEKKFGEFGYGIRYERNIRYDIWQKKMEIQSKY
jgi:hypothetical protein